MTKKKALVAYDDSSMSKKGADEAKNLALMAVLYEVHFVSVMKLKSIGLNRLRNPKGDETVVEGDYSKEMNTLREAFKADGIQTHSEVLIAGANENHGAAICQYADENNIDLIIIGSRGLGNMQQLILGSVSNYVVQNATCPVMVMK
jgi:nucleotide-binding universal stress UspA family protein